MACEIRLWFSYVFSENTQGIFRKPELMKTLARKLESWENVSMKTTIDLPDDLVRRMKLRAVREGKKIREIAAEVVRRGLDESSKNATLGHRVQLPLINCKAAAAGTEMNPQEIADTLNKQEVDWTNEVAGR